jgi:hypothetical protein
MMELVESIAAKQTAIDETNWPLWCNRLEQTLRQTGDSAVVKYFREVLGLNPLSPLHQPSFRPSYAESNDTAPGKTYFDALTRVEESWKVNGLNPLEEWHELGIPRLGCGGYFAAQAGRYRCSGTVH